MYDISVWSLPPHLKVSKILLSSCQETNVAQLQELRESLPHMELPDDFKTRKSHPQMKSDLRFRLVSLFYMKWYWCSMYRRSDDFFVKERYACMDKLSFQDCRTFTLRPPENLKPISDSDADIQLPIQVLPGAQFLSCSDQYKTCESKIKQLTILIRVTKWFKCIERHSWES